jgi:hypothetical protein
MDQPMHADLRGIGGVESADVSNGVLLGLIVIVAGESFREELKERLVGRTIIHFPENLLNLAKETARCKFAIARAPEVTFDFGHIKIMFLQRQPDFRRESMYKLCAKVNGVIQSWIELREYAAADAFAALDDFNTKPCAREINGCGEAGYAGAEDKNVRGHELLELRLKVKVPTLSQRTREGWGTRSRRWASPDAGQPRRLSLRELFRDGRRSVNEG